MSGHVNAVQFLFIWHLRTVMPPRLKLASWPLLLLLLHCIQGKPWLIFLWGEASFFILMRFGYIKVIWIGEGRSLFKVSSTFIILLWRHLRFDISVYLIKNFQKAINLRVNWVQIEVLIRYFDNTHMFGHCVGKIMHGVARWVTISQILKSKSYWFLCL